MIFLAHVHYSRLLTQNKFLYTFWLTLDRFEVSVPISLNMPQTALSSSRHLSFGDRLFYLLLIHFNSEFARAKANLRGEARWYFFSRSSDGIIQNLADRYDSRIHASYWIRSRFIRHMNVCFPKRNSRHLLDENLGVSLRSYKLWSIFWDEKYRNTLIRFLPMISTIEGLQNWNAHSSVQLFTIIPRQGHFTSANNYNGKRQTCSK